jgi:hypothetical protein
MYLVFLQFVLSMFGLMMGGGIGSKDHIVLWTSKILLRFRYFYG